jgi:membrane protein DedA with SNARE-associated domain
MGIKMAVVILAGVFGGQKLDEINQNETPWFTLSLSIISVAVAIYFVISDTQK